MQPRSKEEDSRVSTSSVMNERLGVRLELELAPEAAAAAAAAASAVAEANALSTRDIAAEDGGIGKRYALADPSSMNLV
jgi:hypothetical protein